MGFSQSVSYLVQDLPGKNHSATKGEENDRPKDSSKCDEEKITLLPGIELQSSGP
jgi:hypothetical protein